MGRCKQSARKHAQPVDVAPANLADKSLESNPKRNGPCSVLCGDSTT